MKTIYELYVSLTGIDHRSAYKVFSTLLNLQKNIDAKLKIADTPNDVLAVYSFCREILTREQAFRNACSDAQVKAVSGERLVRNAGRSIWKLETRFNEY